MPIMLLQKFVWSGEQNLPYFPNITKNSHREDPQKVNTHTDMNDMSVRVAAHRANELMCIIQNLEHHGVEWLDKNDVDILKSDESNQTYVSVL